MKPLPRSDHDSLQAAEGWLELGNRVEAEAEMERISPHYRDHPDVLEVGWHIHAQKRKWESCVEISEAIVRQVPERPEGWIHRSFALHELGRTREAFDQLLPAAEKFLTVWTIPYNLACYCAQLGQLKQARQWIEAAIKVDEATVRRAAEGDPDLKPLWDDMKGAL